MKRNSFIILAVALLLAGIVGTFLFYSFYVVENVFVYPMDVEVGESRGVIGMNLDPDKMHFGLLPPAGFSGKRFITVANSEDYEVEVVLQNKGEIKNWLSLEIEEKNETFRREGSFILGPREEARIVYWLTVPTGVETNRTYEGTVKVLVKRTSLFG